MGGLGNQMFQYAAGRALALARSAELVLDTTTFFARDRMFRRSYELNQFPIHARAASFDERWAFRFELAARKVSGGRVRQVARRPWGCLITETDGAHAIGGLAGDPRRVFLMGYWQTERHFSAIRATVAEELRPPASRKPAFVDMARLLESPDAIAVGVRLFEEVPGAAKEGVGGLVPIEAYTRAARLVAERVRNPQFFVFSTVKSPLFEGLNLPGPVHYVTHDNGFEGTVDRLWLLSRCSRFVIANSSYYWWAAWLAESERREITVAAFDKFPNPLTIPDRWIKLPADAG
jgi:hypothetical protein